MSKDRGREPVPFYYPPLYGCRWLLECTHASPAAVGITALLCTPDRVLGRHKGKMHLIASAPWRYLPDASHHQPGADHVTRGICQAPCLPLIPLDLPLYRKKGHFPGSRHQLAKEQSTDSGKRFTHGALRRKARSPGLPRQLAFG